jgi:hypothetical protein
MNADFLHTTLGCTGVPVFRLGLAASYRPVERTVRRTLDEGVNSDICFGADSQAIRVLRGLSADQRELTRPAGVAGSGRQARP